MTTYYTESFYRWQISDKITTTEACPFTIRVTKTPNKTVGLLTISPDTEFEEIVEYATTANPNELSITKRGINPSCTWLVTSWTDYNNTTYQKAHAIGDLVRWDVNHIHLNQVIDVAVWITPYSIYDAVVASTWGNYTTLKDAIDWGKKNILIKGSVTETTTTSITLTQDVKIDFASWANLTATLNTTNYLLSWNYNVIINWGSITINWTTDVWVVKWKFVINDCIINLSSTAWITWRLWDAFSTLLNKYNWCTFNITWASWNKTITFDWTPTVYMNCRFNISASSSTWQAYNWSEFYNCYINFSNWDIGSRFEAFSWLLNWCTVIVSWIWWSDNSAFINNSVITSNVTWGWTQLFKWNISNSYLGIAEIAWQTTIDWKIINSEIWWGFRVTQTAWSSFIWWKWVSSIYSWPTQVFANWIFSWNYVETKSTTVAWSATVTWVFTNNICADTFWTFTTTWAWVIANNQLS